MTNLGGGLEVRMKFEKVSEDKLKVVLGADDLIKWNVTYETIAHDNPNSNEMFWDILHMAEKETGMVFENCSLRVEAIPKDEFTFIIYITKSEFPVHKSRELNEKRYTYRRKVSKHMSMLATYRFDSFEDLVEFTGENSQFAMLMVDSTKLYKYENAFYLVVNIEGSAVSIIREFNHLVSEYATRVRNGDYAYFLEEHGVVLIEKDVFQVIFNHFV